jgi:hypothetical protein
MTCAQGIGGWALKSGLLDWVTWRLFAIGMIVKMYREIQKTQEFQYFVDSVDLCEPKRISAHALILLNDQR